jgi:DNA polymerase gamma 1
VAFFSQVDIDTVLRKEVNIQCTHPNGEAIAPGEAFSIEKIIEFTGGTLQKAVSKEGRKSKNDLQKLEAAEC